MRNLEMNFTPAMTAADLDRLLTGSNTAATPTEGAAA
jgi:hypothetical protein